jgi:hypothetical protein
VYVVCPSDVPQQGAPCSLPAGADQALACEYGDDPRGGALLDLWHCRPWNASDVGPGCPARRPLLGTACGAVPDGTECHYDPCPLGPSLGPGMQCSGGMWTYDLAGNCTCTIAACP